MKNLTKIIAGTVMCVCICSAPMTSFAATPQEAEAVARQYGIPEETIQEFWNIYYESPELYPPEKIDELIAQFKSYQEGIITEVPYNPNAQVPTVTQTTAVPTTSNSQTATTETPNTEVADNSITLTMPDGTKFTRISAEDFIALSYNDKLTYLSTFPEEQQTVIINNLTPEEYKSLMKQLPAEDKLNVVDNLAKISDSMGVNLTVNEITDNSISYEMKNKDGEIVGVGSINDTIEDTGYDRRGIFALAGAFIMTGIAGMALLIRKCFSREKDNE